MDIIDSITLDILAIKLINHIYDNNELILSDIKVFERIIFFSTSKSELYSMKEVLKLSNNEYKKYKEQIPTN